MPAKAEVLKQLVCMSRHLGRPKRDYVIMGEGNTSARIDEATFWVKASGSPLHRIGRRGFVQMRFDRVLALLDGDDLDDEAVKRGLAEARSDPEAAAWPSIEAMLHALVLTATDAMFVGHTHPTAVNAILCSNDAEAVLAGRLFPEEITFCGPAPAFVPYCDPGLPLARGLGQVLSGFLSAHGDWPRVILLQNHGMIALGRTPQEVQNTTAMYVKTARVLTGSRALGGPRFLTERDVQRIRTRPDELRRQQRLGGLDVQP